MREYGTPGGLYLAYDLNLDAGLYEVVNESGDLLAAFPNEADAQEFCAAGTQA